jgi:GNAT superfamily N-acetyltransferase
MVHPIWQQKGVGRLLWQRMREDLAALSAGSAAVAVAVSPWVRAQNTAARSWLEALGFVHVHKDGPVQLTVADAADLSPFTAITQRLAQQRGVVITTLSTEMEKSSKALATFYELFQEVEKDVPGYSAANRTSFEQCMQDLQQPGMRSESVFIAAQGDQYVGLSILGQKVSPSDQRFAGGPGCLSQHLTGVRRAYRRQGIALALKVRGIAFAREHGYERILSNSDNPAMRVLNQKLGFRTGPWLIYTKTVP